MRAAAGPIRRNVNAVYGAAVTIAPGGKRARVEVGGMIGWGVETRLKDEVVQACGGEPRRGPLEDLEGTGHGVQLHFARPATLGSRLRRLWHGAVLLAQGFVRRVPFVDFFGGGHVLRQPVGLAC